MDEILRTELKKETARVALTEEQKKTLKRFSSKTLGMLGVLAAAMVVVAIISGKDSIVFCIGLYCVLAVIMLLLELKDKIKLRGFEEIYLIPAYVESVFPINHGKQVRIQYYDFHAGLFNPKTIRLDRMDDAYASARKGSVIVILMGIKKNKLRYIGPKPAKL